MELLLLYKRTLYYMNATSYLINIAFDVFLADLEDNGDSYSGSKMLPSTKQVLVAVPGTQSVLVPLLGPSFLLLFLLSLPSPPSSIPMHHTHAESRKQSSIITSFSLYIYLSIPCIILFNNTTNYAWNHHSSL